jgi:monoamine oxidase
MSKNSNKPATRVGRREFLRNAGAIAGGAGLLATTAGAANSSESPNRIAPDSDYDAIVIGGGFAGVSASRELRQDGLSTLLLEARNRLGGRTFYSDFAGHKVDLGGTWIHWSQPFVWAEKERYDLDVIETPGAATPDHVYLRIGEETHELGLEEILSVIQAFDAYVADGRNIIERPFDIKHQWEQALAADAISAKDRLDQLDLTDIQRVAMDGIIGSTAHNSSENMSYLESLRWFGIPGFSYLPFMDSVARYKFKDGTKSLIDKMIDDGKPDVRLSTPVKRVEDMGDKVRVTTARGEVITAGVAVIALPMNTLPDVEFSPALDSALIAAAEEKHTGRGYKVFIKAKGRLGKFMALGESTEPLSILITYTEEEDHTVLVGFGASEEGLDIYDDEVLQAEAQKYLPSIEVESAFSYDWVLDPYSKGTYCSYKPGWLAKYYDHFQKDTGRLIYAQGDHGEGWRGFIDGAIGAGMRAAERIRHTYS